MHKGYLIYVASLKDFLLFTNSCELNMYCTSIEYAILFSSIEDAEKYCRNLDNPNFKIYPVCPRCHMNYSEPPAISRRDNKTMICSKCGTKEALYDFVGNVKKEEKNQQKAVKCYV